GGPAPQVPVPGLRAMACVAVATFYGILFLAAESQLEVAALLAGAAAAAVLAGRFGLIEKVRAAIAAGPKTFDAAAIAGVLAAALWLHEEHFAILMMTTA